MDVEKNIRCSRMKKESKNPHNCQQRKSINKNICHAADAKEPGKSRQGDVVGKEKEQQGGRPGETKPKRQF